MATDNTQVEAAEDPNGDFARDFAYPITALSDIRDHVLIRKLRVHLLEVGDFDIITTRGALWVRHQGELVFCPPSPSPCALQALPCMILPTSQPNRQTIRHHSCSSSCMRSDLTVNTLSGNVHHAHRTTVLHAALHTERASFSGSDLRIVRVKAVDPTHIATMTFFSESADMVVGFGPNTFVDLYNIKVDGHGLSSTPRYAATQLVDLPCQNSPVATHK
jgi:hypothetical protein